MKLWELDIIPISLFLTIAAIILSNELLAVESLKIFPALDGKTLWRMNLVLQPPTESSSAAPDFIAQLRELKALVDDGILTQAEFDSAKKEILKKI